MSIIIAPFVIGARAAKHPDPKKGFRLAVKHMMYYCAFYVFAIRFIYPRLQ